ncbi:KGG domain-containing protein [Pseudomonas sp. KK4]|uniref:KGG domain-containing protein n=1 Tax=Pseudomonas sp. KK4 TaxID=1855729 RepID=UPI0035304AA1
MAGGGQGNRGGEFADDDSTMTQPGQKGGQASGGRQSADADQWDSDKQGMGRTGSGNFADDRDKASQAGRKGGEHSGGGGRKS